MTAPEVNANHGTGWETVGCPPTGLNTEHGAGWEMVGLPATRVHQPPVLPASSSQRLPVTDKSWEVFKFYIVLWNENSHNISIVQIQDMGMGKATTTAAPLSCPELLAISEGYVGHDGLPQGFSAPKVLSLHTKYIKTVKNFHFL